MTDENGRITPAELLNSGERRFAWATVDGRKAMLRSLTRKEMRRIEDSLYLEDGRQDPERHPRVAEIILVHSWVDPETKKPLLTEDQIRELGDADGRLVAGLAVAAVEHTGYRVTYDLKAIDAAKKN